MFSHRSTTNAKKIKFVNTIRNWSSNVKYFGVNIDNMLKFSKHVMNITNKVKTAKFTLFPLIKQRNPLPINMKLLYLHLYFMPTFNPF